MMGEDKKCVVCGKSGTIKMAIMDGYGDMGRFDVCEGGTCHREIVAKGVAVYEKETP